MKSRPAQKPAIARASTLPAERRRGCASPATASRSQALGLRESRWRFQGSCSSAASGATGRMARCARAMSLSRCRPRRWGCCGCCWPVPAKRSRRKNCWKPSGAWHGRDRRRGPGPVLPSLRGAGPPGPARPGVALAERGLREWRDWGTELMLPHSLAALASALALLAEALDAAARTGERWYESELHRLNAELTMRQAGASLRAAACKARLPARSRSHSGRARRPSSFARR